jgi:LysM repeat protein
MNRLFLFFLITFSPAAQAFSAVPDSTGMVEEGGKKFILHKVDAGQGWYAIARRYHLPLKELKEANPGVGDNLKEGQIIRVPYHFAAALSTTAIAIAKDSALPLPAPPPVLPADTLKPVKSDSSVYHTVASGETLFSLARRYGTTVDKIKKWNNIGDRGIRVGENILVGKGDVAAAAPPVKRDTVIVEMTKTAGKPKGRNPGKKTTYTGPLKEAKENGIAALEETDEISHNKYFALHRTLPAGTIIRVTDSGTGKIVYVKVVGAIPETEENRQFVLKISRLAVMKLDSVQTKFNVELSYGVPGK